LQTDKSIPNNKPDIVVDDKKGTCVLIDNAIFGAKNVTNIVNCKDFTIETRRLRNVKTKLIPVKMATIGPISKSFGKYLSNMPRNHKNQGTTQNSRTGSTAYAFRKVLT
jgi:hypothetical protein